MGGMRVLFRLLAGVVGLSVGALWLVRHFIPLATLADNNEVGGNYLQSFASVYGVIVGFVIFVVWSQFNETRASVQREASDLADLFRVARGFEEPARGEAVALLVEYCETVATEEWAHMRCGLPSEKAALLMERLGKMLVGYDAPNDRQCVLYTAALDRFNDVSDARTCRVATSSARLPGPLWALLVGGGAVAAGSMLFFGLASFWSHAAMASTLSGSLTFILFVVWDLDNPFFGMWNLKPTPFVDTLHMMRRDVATSAAAAATAASSTPAPGADRAPPGAGAHTSGAR
jgi:hypothetical protein